jgi:FtsZ-binding cell division protein ZapB
MEAAFNAQKKPLVDEIESLKNLNETLIQINRDAKNEIAELRENVNHLKSQIGTLEGKL